MNSLLHLQSNRATLKGKCKIYVWTTSEAIRCQRWTANNQTRFFSNYDWTLGLLLLSQDCPCASRSKRIFCSAVLTTRTPYPICIISVQSCKVNRLAKPTPRSRTRRTVRDGHDQQFICRAASTVLYEF